LISDYDLLNVRMLLIILKYWDAILLYYSGVILFILCSQQH
jgi:hypothetical protein